MHRALRSIAVWAVLLHTSIASATDYSFPTTLRFATGVDPSNPAENFPYCFDYKERRVPGSNASTTFRVALVRDRKQFLREMNVSASASGTYTFFSGAATATFDERYTFSSDSLTWLVLFHSDLGRRELYDETLMALPSALLESGKHTEFAARCGRELVSQEYRSITVAAVFSAKNLSDEQRTSLTAKLEGSATMSAWSASATSSFRNFVQEASQVSRVNLEVITVGGSGPADLAPLFTDYSDLQQISEILRSYASKVAFDNAQATRFSTTSMKRYGWNGSVADVGIQDVALGDYYLLFRDAEASKERARSLLQEASAGRLKLAESQAAELRRIFSDSDNLIRLIVSTARDCRKNEISCKPISSFPIVAPSWPKIDPVGAIYQQSKTVQCRANGASIVTPAAFDCTQDANFVAVARWGEVAGLEVIDRFGQRIPPSLGEIEKLSITYAAAKKRMGPDLSEARFLELATGEKLATLTDAESKGWGARPLSLKFLFGAADSSTGGFRTTLTFMFTNTLGTRVDRQAFMY